MRGFSFMGSVAAAAFFASASFVAVGATPGPLTYCGVVKAYTAASATADGSVTIGSRTYVIAAGTAAFDALSPGDRNGSRCVSGDTDAAGRFIRLESAHPYGAVGGSGVTYTICGTIADYQAPQGGRDGLLVLHERGRETIVPTGTQLPLTAGPSQGHRCFSGGLNSSGDAIVTGVATVTGPGGSPQPTLPSLPSTSTRTDLSFGPLVVVLITLCTAAFLGRARHARR